MNPVVKVETCGICPHRVAPCNETYLCKNYKSCTAYRKAFCDKCGIALNPHDDSYQGMPQGLEPFDAHITYCRACSSK